MGLVIGAVSWLDSQSCALSGPRLPLICNGLWLFIYFLLFPQHSEDFIIFAHGLLWRELQRKGPQKIRWKLKHWPWALELAGSEPGASCLRALSVRPPGLPSLPPFLPTSLPDFLSPFFFPPSHLPYCFQTPGHFLKSDSGTVS